MDWTPVAGFVVGISGVVAGAWSTHKASKVQTAGMQAQQHAAAFTAADSMIGNLHADNQQLRAELRADREEHDAGVAALREAQTRLRTRCDENDERNTATIRALRHEVADCSKSIIGLRVLVVDEAAREAVRQELGDVDPGEARRMFRELFGMEPRPLIERRHTQGPLPPEGDRRHVPEAVDDFGDDDP